MTKATETTSKTPKQFLHNMTKLGLLGVASVFILSGCTATTSPGMAQTKNYGKAFRVDNNDKVNVVVTGDKTVDIKPEGKKRLATLIKNDINKLKIKNTERGKSDNYLIQVHITKYDKGNAAARLLLAGAGQIHVDGVISVYSVPTKTKLEEFKINKTFAWGGIYGASTTIKEVAEGFSMGVAETVTQYGKK